MLAVVEEKLDSALLEHHRLFYKAGYHAIMFKLCAIQWAYADEDLDKERLRRLGTPEKVRKARISRLEWRISSIVAENLWPHEYAANKSIRQAEAQARSFTRYSHPEFFDDTEDNRHGQNEWDSEEESRNFTAEYYYLRYFTNHGRHLLA